MNLAQIGIGKQVRIVAISESELRSKLLELGFVQDKLVEVKFHAPFGDPIAVEIDGYVISLRKSEAQLVQVANNI